MYWRTHFVTISYLRNFRTRKDTRIYRLTTHLVDIPTTCYFVLSFVENVCGSDMCFYRNVLLGIFLFSHVRYAAFTVNVRGILYAHFCVVQRFLKFSIVVKAQTIPSSFNLFFIVTHVIIIFVQSVVSRKQSYSKPKSKYYCFLHTVQLTAYNKQRFLAVVQEKRN